MKPHTPNPLALSALAARVAHGVRHMPAADLVLRLAALASGVAVTVWLGIGTTPVAALVTLFATSVCAAITALELTTAALLCERDTDADTEDDGLGMAA